MRGLKMRATKQALMCGVALMAQQAAAAEPDSATDIVVTAERRASRLIDTPISLSAFTSADLQDRDVTRLENLAGFVPGMFIEEGALRTQTLAIRGLSADLNNPGLDQSVGIYVDGVYLGRATPGNASLFDLERIEVLRGPQGALYGKNTIAGAINYITRLPGDELRGRVELGYGNYNTLRVRGAVSGPLGRGVSASLAGAFDKRDGFSENVATGTREDDINSLAVRGALRFQPTDTLDLILRADYSRDRTHSGAVDVLDNGAFAGSPLADADPWDRKIAKDQDSVQDRDVWGVSGEIKWGVGSGELVSLTALRGFKWSNIADNDYTVLDILASGIHEKQSQFSQEFRYGGTAGALTYVAGLYYFHQSLDTEARSHVGPDLGVYPNAVTASIFGDVDTDSFAAFAHGDYAFTEQLSLTVGLRYTYEKKLLQHSQTGDPWGVLLPTTPQRDIRRSEDDFSPTLSLNYKPADDVLLYGRYARGFKSGGFNVFSVTPTDDARYDPEHVDSFELGLKAGLPGVKGWLSLDLFHMNYANLQVNQLQLIGGLPQFVTSNAGRARSQGLEAELHLQPLDGLELAATYSYLNARFTDCQNANTSGDDYTGNRLPYAPRHSGSVSAQYVTPISTNLELFLRGEMALRSRVHFEADNAFSQGGLALFNGRVGVRDDAAGWGVYGWMRNIGNRDYAVSRFGGAIVPGQALQAIGAPRTFGIEASFNF
ncbi:TonB-dependent receptor [Sandaracinobacter neustonicus]|uniref:TonB-dependent receptor n=1 Tax=Sandaracinobacter neustonicus TaxID=1715348 RepID=A0A501XL30_9SPHN|nr:TonB-dependent receptor [Sandaracinobacter neustonicus]TPE61372.1 TonB-dependent receptor [Sandaracinobacter neustonicus]